MRIPIKTGTTVTHIIDTPDDLPDMEIEYDAITVDLGEEGILVAADNDPTMPATVAFRKFVDQLAGMKRAPSELETVRMIHDALRVGFDLGTSQLAEANDNPFYIVPVNMLEGE